MTRGRTIIGPCCSLDSVSPLRVGGITFGANGRGLSFSMNFWNKVVRTATCWDWNGTLTPSGYGVVHTKHRGGVKGAHRIAFELMRGPIPAGMVLDHLCRNRRCVNPQHLEVVSRAENTMRGYGVTALQARQTHCHRGHPLDGANVSVGRQKSHTYRRCNACRRVTAKARRNTGVTTRA